MMHLYQIAPIVASCLIAVRAADYAKKFMAPQSHGSEAGGNFQGDFTSKYAADYQKYMSTGDEGKTGNLPPFVEKFVGGHAKGFEAYMNEPGFKAEANASSPSESNYGDYQKYMKQGSQGSSGSQGGDYQQYVKQYAGDYQKYMKGSQGSSGSQGGDYQQYMKQYAGDYQKYMTQGSQGGSQSSQETKPSLFELASSKNSTAPKEVPQGSSGPHGGDYQQYMKQYAGDYQKYMSGSQGGDYQQYMKQYAGDYQKYMRGSQGSSGSQSGDYQQYMKQYAGDYQKYMKGSQGSSGSQGGDYQQYMKKYAGDVIIM